VAFAETCTYLSAMMRTRLVLLGVAIATAATVTLVPPVEAKKKPPAPPPPAPEAAEGAQALGTVSGWTAYMSKDKTGRVCYVFGQPQRSEPAGTKRKSPMMMVTHRPDEKIANVVSVVEGYPIKEGSDIQLEVGKSKFDLFAKEDSAWARTSDLDKTIVTALGKAKQAVAKGNPQKGPGTTDIYALNGFPQALAMIDKACGVKR
jgi:hypothetical protein